MAVRFTFTRHRLTRRGLLGLCAGFVPLASRAAVRKKSKKEAAYQDRPMGISSCGSCSLFQAPKSCAVVQGSVSRNGWCNLYVPVD